MSLRFFFPATVALAAFAGASAGQNAEHDSSFDAFEVATVKPTAPEDTGVNKGRYIRMQSAHRFQAKNCTVSGLISAAYDLNPKMIYGDRRGWKRIATT